MTDWGTFLSAMTLALVRVSGMVLFAPFFSSDALPMRTKAVFVGAVAWLLAPLVATLPGAQVSLSFAALLGDLHEESYIHVQDVRAAAYGYGGRTQEWRYQHA